MNRDEMWFDYDDMWHRLGARSSIHRKDNDMPRKYTLYNHHGSEVWVRTLLKGQHRSYCLCWFCDKFNPGGDRDDNCPIANILYRLDKGLDITTPVWECADFVEREYPRTPPPPAPAEINVEQMEAVDRKIDGARQHIDGACMHLTQAEAYMQECAAVIDGADGAPIPGRRTTQEIRDEIARLTGLIAQWDYKIATLPGGYAHEVEYDKLWAQREKLKLKRSQLYWVLGTAALAP